MDHIYIAPNSALTELDLVPVNVDEEYKGIPFLQYVEKYRALDDVSQFIRMSSDECDRIFQSLFFFSLLQEILGPVFCHDHFIRQKSIGAAHDEVLFVSTIYLEERLQELNMLVRTGSSHHKNLRDHLVECFTQSRIIYHRLISNVSRASRLMVSTSIPYLCTAVERIASAEIIPNMPSIRPGIIDPVDLDIMTRVGKWCPFEASRAWRSFLQSGTSMLLRSIKSSATDTRHSGCSQDRCDIAFIKAESYQHTHTSSTCDCEFWSIEQGAVEKITESDNLAMLQVDLDEHGGVNCIEVIAYSEKAAFVAISHVWSDGLGNQSSNGLRTCQIHRLVGKVFDFVAAQTNLDRRRILIWLDTICVPAQPGPAKSKALENIKEAYVQAAHVLVLDSWLQEIDFDSDALLVGTVALFASRWMRRLWTLQEALFAKNLWFKFANMTVEIEWLWAELRALRGTIPCNQYRIVLDLLGQIELVRLHQGRLWMNRKSLHIRNVQSAVKERLVSNKSDEPLCLGALTDLKVSTPDVSPDTRMASFWWQWVQHHDIQQDIIFNRFPRLTISPFKWAPATFLDQNLLQHRDRAYFPYSNCPGASFHEAGLKVQFPGLLIKCQSSRYTCQKVLNTVAAQNFGFVLAWSDHAKRWFQIALDDCDSKVLERLRETNYCGIIMNTPPTRQKSSDGLLVSFKEPQAVLVGTVLNCSVYLCSGEEEELLTHMKGETPWTEIETYAIQDQFETWQSLYFDNKAVGDQRSRRDWILDLSSMLRTGLYFEIEGFFDESKNWIVD